jgi:hypothetical protein
MTDPRVPDGLSLVYLPHGKVAHMSTHDMLDTSCNAVLLSEDRYGLISGTPWLLGTGNQDEWEKARLLPLCKRCFPTGPRRPLEEKND